MEDAIQQEAEEQARQLERMRGRFNELMSIAYERAIEYLENEDFVQQMRPQDVIHIIRLHVEAIEKQGGFNPPEQEVEWTEDELAEVDRILEEIEAEEPQEEPEEGSGEGDETPKDSEGDID